MGQKPTKPASEIDYVYILTYPEKQYDLTDEQKYNIVANILKENNKKIKMAAIKIVISRGLLPKTYKVPFIYDAIQEDNDELLKLIIDHQIGKATTENDPLKISINRKSEKCIRVLIEKKYFNPRIKVVSNMIEHQNMFHFAVSRGCDKTILNALLNNGCDINDTPDGEHILIKVLANKETIGMFPFLYSHPNINHDSYNHLKLLIHIMKHLDKTSKNIDVIKLVLENPKFKMDFVVSRDILPSYLQGPTEEKDIDLFDQYFRKHFATASPELLEQGRVNTLKFDCHLIEYIECVYLRYDVSNEIKKLLYLRCRAIYEKTELPEPICRIINTL